MDKSDNNYKLVIFILVGAVLIGGAIVSFVGLPMWNSFQEARRREECTKNLRKIGIALDNYSDSIKIFPPDLLQDMTNFDTGADATQSPSRTKLHFDSYNGYFVSNKFEPETAESFVVIDNQERFNDIFGIAAVMDDKARRLPSDVFKSNFVLAVIKRGHALWEFKVESVMEDEGVVSFHYATSSKKSDSTTFASPLIVSIPKGKYSSVQFIENGKPVKTISPEGKSKER